MISPPSQSTIKTRLTKKVRLTMSEVIDTLLAAHKAAEAYRTENETRRYPAEFKRRVVSAHKSGLQTNRICKLTGMALSTIDKWVRSGSKDHPEAIPVEWISPKPPGNAMIQMPSGIVLEMPLEALTEKIFTWIVRAS
jgi:hypothetical protein